MDESVTMPAPEAEKPKTMPGQCGRCNRMVEFEAIVWDDGKPLHRAVVKGKGGRPHGALCGPVYTVWSYHVAFTLSTPMGVTFERSREHIPCPIESGNALELVEMSLAARAPKMPPPPGPVVLGQSEAMAPTVTILTWKLLGRGWPNLPVEIPPGDEPKKPLDTEA